MALRIRGAGLLVSYLADMRQHLALPIRESISANAQLHISLRYPFNGVQPSYAMPLCGQTPRISTKVMPTKSARDWSPVPGNGPLLDAAFAFVRLNQYVPVAYVSRPARVAEYKSSVTGRRSDGVKP